MALYAAMTPRARSPRERAVGILPPLTNLADPTNLANPADLADPTDLAHLADCGEDANGNPDLDSPYMPM